MFEEGIYSSIFYCLCSVKVIPMDILEEQVREKRDPNLDMKDCIRISDDKKEHWKYIFEDNIN